MIRAAAWIGWLADAVSRVMAAIAWFAPRRTPWPALIAGLLILGASTSLLDARAELAAQPRPLAVALRDVVDSTFTGWVATSSVVWGPFLETGGDGLAVQRWYYLLTDPHDGEIAMVARSPERLEERRLRTIVVRIVADPDAAAASAAGFSVRDLVVDPDHYLVELPDRRPMDPLHVTGPGIDLSGASEVEFRGSFDQARAAPDGDGWEYLATDGQRATVVRSPYPPDALPVDVWGVPATDLLRARQAAAVPELQSALDGRRLPERTLLAEGVTPPLREISFAMPIVLALLAGLLALGWVIGYPVYRRRPTPGEIASWPFERGDEIGVALYGVDATNPTPVRVIGAPARLELVGRLELERRGWQLGLGGATRPSRSAEGSDDAGPPILALSSGEGPILVRLDDVGPDVRIGTGTLTDAVRRRPALRLARARLDLVLSFDTPIDRERALVALDPCRLAVRRPGRPPQHQVSPRAVVASDALPIPVRAAAVAIGAVGGVVALAGAIGLAGAMTTGGAFLPGFAQLTVGAGIVAAARGVWLRRGWAREIGFTVGWVGAAVSAFLVVAAPQCGLWLAPNLVACQAAGPLGAAAALAASVGLAYAALTIRRHARAFDR